MKCKYFNCTGNFRKRFQQQLKGKIHGHQVEVTVKLHLIMTNAEKKSVLYPCREVTTANYRECFSLIRESALFEFGAFNIAHDDAGIEATIQQELSKKCCSI